MHSCAFKTFCFYYAYLIKLIKVAIMFYIIYIWKIFSTIIRIIYGYCCLARRIEHNCIICVIFCWYLVVEIWQFSDMWQHFLIKMLQIYKYDWINASTKIISSLTFKINLIWKNVWQPLLILYNYAQPI